MKKLSEQMEQLHDRYLRGHPVADDIKHFTKKVALLEDALQDIMHGTKDEWAEKIARNALEKQL